MSKARENNKVENRLRNVMEVERNMVIREHLKRGDVSRN